MFKKGILKLLSAVLSCLLVFACVACNGGKKDSSEYVDDGNGNRVQVKTLNWLHIWPECAGTMTKIANDFMAENKDIKINIQQSTHSDVDSYLNMQLLSGSLPDVFFYWTHMVSSYVDFEACLDLTPYADGWKNTFVNGGEAWDIAKFGGKYYNVPFRSTGYIIVYNKTMFDNLELAEPTTIEEFENVLSVIRKSVANQSFSPLAATGIVGGTIPQLYTAFENFVSLQTEVYKDVNYKSGLVAPTADDNARLAKILDKLKSWTEKGYFGHAEGKSESSAITNFVQGNAAMVLMNNNNLYLLEDMEEETELGVISIPAPAGYDYKYVYGGYDGFSIASTTEHPEESVRFLKYLTSPAVQQYFAGEEASIMAADGVDYKDGMQSKIAVAMKDVGNAKLVQNEIKYALGTYADANASLALNYMLGNSNLSAAEVAATIAENNAKGIKDSGLSQVQRTQPVPDGLDFSWLDLK